jgi:parallel beta-helix repeat protein
VRRILGLSGAVVAATVLLMTCAGQALAEVHCGDVITQDTTLDSDLFCGDGGLQVGDPSIPTPPGLTLSLGGHTLQGAVGVTSADQAVVADGTVLGGIDVGRGSATVRNLLIVPQEFPHDVGVFAAHAEVTVAGNVIRGGRFGIESSSAIVTATGNRIAAADEFGIVTDGGTTVTGNVIEGNGLTGIESSRGVVAERNRVTGNGADGIHLFDRGGSRVIGNVTDRNGRDGIRLEPNPLGPLGHFAQISGNHAWRNGTLGIEGPPGTLGGANWAKHNGNPAQCVPAGLCSTKGRPKG